MRITEQRFRLKYTHESTIRTLDAGEGDLGWAIQRALGLLDAGNDVTFQQVRSEDEGK